MQAVVDLMQLVRVIQVGIDVDGDGQADLDPTRIYYLGDSASAMHGLPFLTVEPDVRTGALIVINGGPRIHNSRFQPGGRAGVGRLLDARRPSLINAPGLTSIGGIPVGPPYFDENLPLPHQPPVINTVPGAQTQIAVFLASDGKEIIHPEPRRFFEVPVVPPLPEDFGFIP